MRHLSMFTVIVCSRSAHLVDHCLASKSCSIRIQYLVKQTFWAFAAFEWLSISHCSSLNSEYHVLILAAWNECSPDAATFLRFRGQSRGLSQEQDGNDIRYLQMQAAPDLRCRSSLTLHVVGNDG